MPAFANVNDSYIVGNTINDVVGTQTNNFNNDYRSHYGNTTSYGATNSHNTHSGTDRSIGTTNYNNSGTFNNHEPSTNHRYSGTMPQPNETRSSPYDSHTAPPVAPPDMMAQMEYWKNFAAQLGVDISSSMPNNRGPTAHGPGTNDPRAPVPQGYVPRVPQFKSNNPFRQHVLDPPSRDHSNSTPFGNPPYHNSPAAAEPVPRPLEPHTHTAPAIHSMQENLEPREGRGQAENSEEEDGFSDIGANFSNEPTFNADPWRS